MNESELVNYLIDLRLLTSPKVTVLGKGESNVNYLAEEGDIKYVVRMSRSDMPGSSRYESEHHYMLFVESCGIEFAPRSIHYDQERDIHIVSYVDGEDASVADLTDVQTEVFIEQLKRLGNITYDDYLSWCKQARQEPRRPQTLAVRNKVNIENRLLTISEASTSNPFAKEVIAWATPKVEILSAAEKEADLRTTFLHDDLRWTDYGGNLKIVGEQIYFIDWELSGFFADAVPEIGDVLGSIPDTTDNQTILKRLYEDYAGGEADREKLDKSIRYGVLWGKLGNPLWAAERYFILGEHYPTVERYKTLAENGMKDAERFFDTSFERWFQ